MNVDTRSSETRLNAACPEIIDAPQHKVAEITLEPGRWRLVAALRDARDVCLTPFEAIRFPPSELRDD